ncbi:MXAN_5187 C-terminal domain-containing protein [Hyalangium versicolor]|uniref:MXAN_5187 C-terminal domain-containing protein n=1 Tax=Hyalangium versicolor TaxID=2861190 RepID=UPI001CCC7233|nr:MXAN_5187 C-terminal domain-containing protein [Hyalangium versicolor]
MKLLGDDEQDKRSNNEKAAEECHALEEELMALKVVYEQYFLGNERLPPVRAHEDLKKRLMKLKTGLVRNTAVKFRISSLYNKFLTYERMWQRTLQEIESGTYKRDLFKAKRRAQKAGGGEKKKGAFDLTEEISEEEFEEVADIIPNEPKPAQPEPSRFIPRPVEPEPAAVSFRPVPSVAAAPAVPAVPTVAPSMAPVAASGGTPFRGTPSVAPVPSVPTVAPAAGAPARTISTPPPVGTPLKGTPSIAPVAAKSATTIPPGSTPSKGSPTIPPGSTPSKGSPTIPPGGTPSKGSPTIPPGGTPARGTSGISGTPGRGVPAFGAPSQSTSGIAAALESLTDEPLGKPAAPASTASRPPPSAAARPGANPSTAGSKPGVPAAKPASSPSQAPKPAAAASSNLSDDKLKAVYDAYVTAKRRNQEDTSKMSYESVAANLRKQVPELLKQHNAKSVEFKVVIKDGKATLKAVPK